MLPIPKLFIINDARKQETGADVHKVANLLAIYRINYSHDLLTSLLAQGDIKKYLLLVYIGWCAEKALEQYARHGNINMAMDAFHELTDQVKKVRRKDVPQKFLPEKISKSKPLTATDSK